MKSNLFSKATALGVVATLAFSTSVFAFSEVTTMTPPTQQKSMGDNTVTAPTYKVKVPAALAFAVDPYELGGLATGSALNHRSAIKVPGYGYAVSNQSNIAVAVGVEAFIVPAANVYTVPLQDINTQFTDPATGTFFSSTAPITPDDATNTAKEVSMYLLIASTSAVALTGTNPVPGTPVDGTVYTSAGAIEMNTLSADTTVKPARATMILDKNAVAANAINNSATGVACFSLQGDVNSLATWAAKDISVTVRYTFAPVSEANRNDNATVGYQSGMSTVVSGSGLKADNSPEKPVAGTIGTVATEIIKTALPTDVTNVSVTPGSGYKAVSHATGSTMLVKFVGPAPTYTIYALGATDFDWSAIDTLVLKKTAFEKLKTAPNGNYTLEATAKNGKTVKTVAFELK